MMEKSELKEVVTNTDLDTKERNQFGDARVELNEQEYVLTDKYSDQKLQKSTKSVNVKETCIIIPDEKDIGGNMNENYKVKEYKDQQAYNDPNTRRGYVSDGGAYQARVDVSEAPPPTHGRRTRYDEDENGNRPRRNSMQYYREVDIVFEAQGVRRAFIRKVYTILAVMLLYTFGFIAVCLFEKNTKLWVLENGIPLLIAMVTLLVTILVLTCCKAPRRVFPINFLLLSLLTVSMAYFAAFISCYCGTNIVMSAFGGTALICVVVTFVAWQDWFDVTTWGMYLFIALVVVLVYGIVAIIVHIFTGDSITYLIFSCIACLLFSMFLMYDTQQIVGGKRIQLSPEEYILGAVQLYVDIITLFIFLMDTIAYFC